jgi:hypothetical protein
MTESTGGRRRRRVRGDGTAEASGPSAGDGAATTSAIHDSDELAGHDEREVERGLRGLVGGGSSQVGVAAAMRARDAARPSDEEMAAAEANLIIVRRGWTPPPGPAR